MENQDPQKTGPANADDPVFVVYNTNSNKEGQVSCYPALAYPTPIIDDDLQTRPDYLMSCQIAASSRCTLYQMGVRG